MAVPTLIEQTAEGRAICPRCVRSAGVSRWVLLAWVMALTAAFPAVGHETDQFTLPPDREFADIGDHLNRWIYRILDGSVEQANAEIRRAVERGDDEHLKTLQSPEYIARTVNGRLPWAMDVIEGLERVLHSPEMKRKHPGKIVGYKEPFGNIYQKVHFPLDPRQFFRLFLGSTFKAYGVYLGTDKIGHFTDMGMNYYRAYRRALAEGKSEEEAVREAIGVGQRGLIFSERGMLGYLSAGAYSNADMVSNYLGFLFYKNLTDPVMLKGELQPPLLAREGPYWKLAPHVRRDSQFFSLFISEHLNEALNPSHFEGGMRSAVRRAVRERTELILQRYSDENGQPRPKRYFDEKLQELKTYYGVDYGHRGRTEELIYVGNTCFAPAERTLARLDDAPLFLSAGVGDGDSVRRALANGTDVNASIASSRVYPSEQGKTALHLASREGHTDVVRLLLEGGADARAAGPTGVTPLHRAIHHPEIAAVLMARAADPNLGDGRGRTALHWAAVDLEAEALPVLLSRGARVDLPDHEGQTPLHQAAAAGNDRAVAKLLEAGAEINARDRFNITPAHLAAAQRDESAFRILVERGADVRARDDFGRTPLHDAARAGSEHGVALLIRSGADVNARDSYGTTPLHLACRQARVLIAQTLLENGADANAQNAAGSTPLHEAALARDKEIVSMLLARGAEPDVSNRRGMTPAEVAGSKKAGAVARLLKKGAR